MFTSGFELTTAITNILIFIVSFYAYKNTNDRLWKLFFGLVSIDAFIGTIVHGIVMSELVNNILWIILSLFFTVTVNTILAIFIKKDIKFILLSSIVLSLILLLEMALGLDYIFTFVMCVLIVLLIGIVVIIKNKPINIYILLGIVIELLGGLPYFLRLKILGLNHNGIIHLFLVITELFFYIGVKKIKSNE